MQPLLREPLLQFFCLPREGKEEGIIWQVEVTVKVALSSKKNDILRIITSLFSPAQPHTCHLITLVLGCFFQLFTTFILTTTETILFKPFYGLESFCLHLFAFCNFLGRRRLFLFTCFFSEYAACVLTFRNSKNSKKTKNSKEI